MVPETEAVKMKLKVLLADYERSDAETFKLSQTIERLILLALLVLAAVISVEYIPEAKDLMSKNWVANFFSPAVLAVVLATLVMHYAVMNGLVYHQRNLETRIHHLLSLADPGSTGGAVPQYENQFARWFYSPRTGNKSLLLLHVLTLVGVAGTYFGAVWTCFERLQEFPSLRPWGLVAYFGLYFLFAVALGAGLCAATFRVREQYEARMGMLRTPVRPHLPLARLLVQRPQEIIGKGPFFWCALIVGALLSRAGWASIPWGKAVVAWLCLELIVNQAKYSLNELHDAATDRDFQSIRGNALSAFVDREEGRSALRWFGGLVTAKAALGTVLGCYLVSLSVGLLIGGLFLLQWVYDIGKRCMSPRQPLKWLARCRPAEPNMEVRQGEGERTRVDKAKGVRLLGDQTVAVPRSAGWALGSCGLGLVLGSGYAVRLAIPMQLLGLERKSQWLFASFLAWGVGLGFALIMAYWSSGLPHAWSHADPRRWAPALRDRVIPGI